MPEILFHYERVNPTSWAYLSSLLTLALFFKFNRIFSVRNVDLFLLIALAPGLLLVQWAWENKGLVENAARIEHWGYLWLLTTELVLLVRMLMDTAMVRRPLLESNLNPAGQLFLGGALLFFLMANIVTGNPKPEDLNPARQAEEVRVDEATDVQEDSFATDGPGFFLLYRMPRISTQTVIGASPKEQSATPSEIASQELRIQEATARVMAILSHALIVSGMLIIGYVHFDNIAMGISACALYLLLPYTALFTGDVVHALPGSLLVWAVVLYRRPLLAGTMIGLASGTIYYPAFLIPLWCSFYWDRGVKRFAAGVILMLCVLALTLAFTATDYESFVGNLLRMFGLRLPSKALLEGIWQFWNPVFRYPTLAAFVALSFSFVIWPFQKNLGTLICCTGAIMIGVQFWHAHDGGVFVAWFLPLLLLTIFRPNLEDHNALTKIGEDWFTLRRRTRHVGAGI